ncbi:uncharacterized protein L201_005172 [Kwoniella dendrophila CBS 6074]|uniref:Uncharacterized protein n=1 Tax=Kwoniella dendrophila CBS 6074 TaxID=1295534 RepID=A0AAX4JYH6_9TREE
MLNQHQRRVNPGIGANRQSIPRYTSYTPQHSPFLSHQTITFLASWRGQLLVCTIVLILGAIYFFVKPPIDQWHIRRKEALSRKRELELMKMSEKENKNPTNQEEKDDLSKSSSISGSNGIGGSTKERGRDKNKQNRKRMNSHLRPSTNNINNNDSTDSTITGLSSIESSPAPMSKQSILSPSKSKKSLSSSSTSTPVTPITPSSKSRVKLQPKQNLATPTRNKPPPPIIVPKPEPITTSPGPTNPWEVPLPVSPIAGPSRLNGSVNGVSGLGLEEISDTASVSTNNEENVKSQAEGEEIRPELKKKSEGFSIYPEEGYLPATYQTPNGNVNKKKKKKGKTPQLPNGSFTTISSTAANDPQPIIETSSTKNNLNSVAAVDAKQNNHLYDGLSKSIESRPNGRSRHQHTRTSSITLLPNLNVLELRKIVERRDETIDQLRAEIGTAKAEESKAKEEAVRARMGEEKLRGDFERSRRSSLNIPNGSNVNGTRSDQQAQNGVTNSVNGDRRREAELQSRLAQIQQLYTTALSRLSTCESALRDSGIMLPPLPSPIPLHLPQSPLPMMPGPPYAPSPGRNTPIIGGTFMPYPSPGMYPSPMPMLHPNLIHTHSHSHSHQQSPSPYRRSSSMNSNNFINNGLAGNGSTPPFSPGFNGNGLGEQNGSLSYPMDIGSSTMPIGLGHPVNNGQGENQIEREKRRQSIESSVMKKKILPLTSNSSSSPSTIDNSNSSISTSGSVVESVDEDKVTEAIEEDVGNSSSQDGMSNQAESIVSNSSSLPHSDHVTSNLNIDRIDKESTIKVMLDSKRGNIYYRPIDVDINQNGNSTSEDQNILSKSPQNGGTALESIDSISSNDVAEQKSRAETLEPIFASLAHTPEQIEEMRQMKLNSISIERCRSVSSSNGSSSLSRGMTAGLGNGGLLTPSPSKSPIPLRE